MKVASVSILVPDSDVAIPQTRIRNRIDSIGTVWFECVVASVSILVSDSDVTIQQNLYCRPD